MVKIQVNLKESKTNSEMDETTNGSFSTKNLELVNLIYRTELVSLGSSRFIEHKQSNFFRFYPITMNLLKHKQFSTRLMAPMHEPSLSRRFRLKNVRAH